jgi:tetratricopeptide (TPR) repeat protein
MNPGNVDAYIYRGDNYNETNKLELALQDYNKAIELSPNNGKIYIYRAVVYMKQKNFQLAWGDVEKAKGMGETDPDLIERLTNESQPKKEPPAPTPPKNVKSTKPKK